MNDDERIDHPSFGKLQISRCTGTADTLVGSPISHRQFIAIRISEATLYRGLHYDRFHEGREIIEILLSPNQFAEAITSLNTEGVPCTLDTIQGKHIERPPAVNERGRIRDEFEKDMKELAATFTANRLAISSLLEQKKGKSLTKDDRALIINTLDAIENQLADSIPFAHTMFDEAMENTVIHAKSEVEAYVSMVQRTLGSEKLLEDPVAELLRLEHEPDDRSILLQLS